jgi:hypothetical protein
VLLLRNPEMYKWLMIDKILWSFSSVLNIAALNSIPDLEWRFKKSPILSTLLFQYVNYKRYIVSSEMGSVNEWRAKKDLKEVMACLKVIT